MVVGTNITVGALSFVAVAVAVAVKPLSGVVWPQVVGVAGAIPVAVQAAERVKG